MNNGALTGGQGLNAVYINLLYNPIDIHVSYTSPADHEHYYFINGGCDSDQNQFTVHSDGTVQYRVLRFKATSEIRIGLFVDVPVVEDSFGDSIDTLLRRYYEFNLCDNSNSVSTFSK
jgi:hypothetical protein